MRLFPLSLISNCLFLFLSLLVFPATAQEKSQENSIDILIEEIEQSPVLQEWLEEVPNVLEEITQDPAFVTRLRLGFTVFPSTDDASGLNVGIEDIFIKRTGLTVSADYQTAFNGDRNLYARRWRIEETFNLLKRLLGLSYLWTGSVNGIQLQLWATWLFYVVLIDLADEVAEQFALPFDSISVEMVFRGIYHFSVALHQGSTINDLVAYLIALLESRLRCGQTDSFCTSFTTP